MKLFLKPYEASNPNPYTKKDLTIPVCVIGIRSDKGALAWRVLRVP